MAHEYPGQMVTLAASTDLTGAQYTFVDVGTDGRLIAPTTGGAVYGILQNKPLEDQAGTVMLNGISKLLTDATTMSVGDLVATSTAGYGVAPTTANEDQVVGRVVGGTSGSTGRKLSVQITSIGRS